MREVIRGSVTKLIVQISGMDEDRWKAEQVECSTQAEFMVYNRHIDELERQGGSEGYEFYTQFTVPTARSSSCKVECRTKPKSGVLPIASSAMDAKSSLCGISVCQRLILRNTTAKRARLTKSFNCLQYNDGIPIGIPSFAFIKRKL